MNFEEIIGHHVLDHPVFRLGRSLVITKHLIVMWIVCALLIVVLTLARKNRKLGLAVEALILFVRDGIVQPTMGDHGKKYTHYFLTLFSFLLFCNLIGLV